jgi:hypothetical protein
MVKSMKQELDAQAKRFMWHTIKPAIIIAPFIAIPLVILLFVLTDVEVEGYDPVLVETNTNITTKEMVYTAIHEEEARQDQLDTANATWDGEYPDIPLSVFANWQFSGGHSEEARRAALEIYLPAAMALHREEPRFYPSYLLAKFAAEPGWIFEGAYGFNFSGMKVLNDVSMPQTAVEYELEQGRWAAGHPTYRDSSSVPDIDTPRVRYIRVGTLNGLVMAVNYPGDIAHKFCATIKEANEVTFKYYFKKDGSIRLAYQYILDDGPLTPGSTPDAQMQAHGNSNWGTSYASLSSVWRDNNFEQFDPGGVSYEKALTYNYGDPWVFEDIKR